MTDNEANEMFEQIVGAEGNADLAEVEAKVQAETPEPDPRKDGVYYHATSEFLGGNIVYYNLVIANRVVAMVRVAEDVAVTRPEAVTAAAGLKPGTTLHPITLVLPDLTNMVTTEGLTFKAPGGILNRTAIKAYVMPRAAQLLVQLYNLGV